MPSNSLAALPVIIALAGVMLNFAVHKIEEGKKQYYSWKSDAWL